MQGAKQRNEWSLAIFLVKGIYVCEFWLSTQVFLLDYDLAAMSKSIPAPQKETLTKNLLSPHRIHIWVEIYQCNHSKNTY